jgi:hypothetical protein
MYYAPTVLFLVLLEPLPFTNPSANVGSHYVVTLLLSVLRN